MNLKICEKCKKQNQRYVHLIKDFDNTLVVECVDMKTFNTMDALRFNKLNDAKLIYEMIANGRAKKMSDLSTVLMNFEINKHCPYYMEHFLNNKDNEF